MTKLIDLPDDLLVKGLEKAIRELEKEIKDNQKELDKMKKTMENDQSNGRKTAKEKPR